jgi:hypothetical protein
VTRLFDRWLEPVLYSGAITYVGYTLLAVIRW